MSMFSYFARVEGFALKVYATSEEEVISRVMTKHGVVPEEVVLLAYAPCHWD